MIIKLKWEHNNSGYECTHAKSGYLVRNVLSRMTHSPVSPNALKIDGLVSSLLCTILLVGLSDQLQICCDCREISPTPAAAFTHRSKYLLLSDAKVSTKILNFAL